MAGVLGVGMRRANKIVPDYSGTKLESGDSLFVQGTWARIQQLASNNHDFVVLELPEELAQAIDMTRMLGGESWCPYPRVILIIDPTLI